MNLSYVLLFYVEKSVVALYRTNNLRTTLRPGSVDFLNGGWTDELEEAVVKKKLAKNWKKLKFQIFVPIRPVT